MIKIKFNDTPEFIDVTFSRPSTHVVSFTGNNLPKNISGFSTYRMDGVTLLGHFPQYTTIYKTVEDSEGNVTELQLSDDGSVCENSTVIENKYNLENTNVVDADTLYKKNLLSELNSSYQSDFNSLKDALILAELRNDAELKAEIQEEFSELQDWYTEEKANIESAAETLPTEPEEEPSVEEEVNIEPEEVTTTEPTEETSVEEIEE